MTTEDGINVKPIAVIHTDFKEKFGIPRQSGLVKELEACLVPEPEYRNRHAFRGIGGFSHLWLLWHFSENVGSGWSPTVRPPRLGGNERVGVFATRSPFRPNGIGLSCVKLLRVENDPEFGVRLYVSGADLMDGTPILDIKPYVPLADCHPDASCGFSAENKEYHLTVDFPEALAEKIPIKKRKALAGVLAEDPRPAYQNDPDRIYGMTFGVYEVRFCVEEKTLHVLSVQEERREKKQRLQE